MIFAFMKKASLLVSYVLVSFGYISGSIVLAQTPNLAPYLKAGHPTHFQNIRVKTTDNQAFDRWLRKNLPHIQAQTITTHSNIVLLTNIDATAFKQLKDCPMIQFIDRGNATPKEEVSFDRRGSWLNKISITHHNYPQLNGEGLFVSVKEQSFDIQDIDFKGRIADTTGLGQDLSSHATEMASIIVGGGNTSPNSLGAAWKAGLYSASFANLLPDDGTTLTNRGISVQNHSYGVGVVENYYGIESQAYDQQLINFPTLVHVFSSGNRGNASDTQGTYQGIVGFANLTGQFKTSKNTLSVGEVDENAEITVFGSRGPAYDGRIKPELVAYGGGGTSESAAVVSGISLLVQHAYKNQQSSLPPASLVKATLINTADDLGRPEVDFEYGFGNVDALGAVNTIQQNRYVNDALTQTNDVKTFNITVPANAKQLKVTLVWNDPPADAGNTKALINDLDLTVTQVSTGTIWQPWVLNTTGQIDSLQLPAKRGEDHLNNVEQITVAFPAAGVYQISVKAFDLKVNNQSFSLAYEYPEGFQWIFPLQNDVLQATRTRRLQWEWNKAAVGGKLELKYTQSNTWQSITTLNDLSVESFNWVVPDTFALAQIRLTANDGFTFTSDTLTIMSPLAPKVGYDCPEEVMIFWEPLAGVTQYQVYKLGTQFLELLAVVQDTLLVISKSNNPGRHFAVAPMITQRPRRLGNTTNVDFSGVNCYFRSFLLSQSLADTVLLNLSLATTYRLAKIELQRRGSDNQAFSTIVTNDPNNTNITFQDVTPLPYRNQYRVALTDVVGNVFYSDSVNALVVAQNDFFLYPNPVKLNELARIVDRRQVIEKVRLINPVGKLIQTYVPDGLVQKDISTEGLKPGIYFVELILTDGSREVKRLVIK
ncbi:hypothetical protein BKI52_08470 [marine bacterium AO1-C]|nr:hypothetical protein BKI52_08470 [marine bacterium AO1-C]